jgi:hypothetical protein
MRRWLGAGVGLLLVAGTIAGLATGNDGSSRDSRAGVNLSGQAPNGVSVASTVVPLAAKGSAGIADSAQANAGAGQAVGAASGATATGGPALVAPPIPPAPIVAHNQKIVKNATLTVEIKRDGFRPAFDRAASVAEAHGGFVVSSDSTQDRGTLSVGSLVIRVPVAAFDAVRKELSQLGTVKNEQLSGEDVSSQVVDLDAHITSLQAQEAALRTLMSKATTIGDTIQVQGQLTQVRQQIEQYAGEKARLNDAADLATIHLSLAEVGALAPSPGPKPAPANALARSVRLAVHGAAVVTGGTLIVLGWLLPLALLGLLGWGAWRLTLGRRPHLDPAA